MKVIAVSTFDTVGGLAMIAAFTIAILVARPWRPDPNDQGEEQ